MKKFALLIGMLVLTMNVFAQNKGDIYIGPSLSASYGKQYAAYYTSYQAYYASKPYDFSLNPSCEFGFFVANNFRLGVALGIPYSAYVDVETEDGWDIDYSLGISINPSMAYYVRLADRLYYTPEIGFKCEVWTDFPRLQDFTDFENNYFGFSVYANLFDLEFRVNEKLALGVGVGSIYYTHARKLRSASGILENSLWYINFNNGMVSVKFYL